MITYRTCLFDMRLDDLWDPAQRWALLSDTGASTRGPSRWYFFTNIIFGQLVFSQFTSMKVLVRSNRRCWGTVSKAATSQAMG